MTRNMATYGCLTPKTVSGLTPRAGTGCIPITATPGCLTIPGDGLPFTMAAGALITIMAGSGYRAMNGRLPGLAGGTEAAIMAGRHYCRALA